MNIAILSFRPLDRPLAAEDELLMEAGRALGHQMILLRAPHLQLFFAENKSVLLYEGKELPAIDVLIPRASILTEVEKRIAVIHQFELSGIQVVNSFDSICKAKNKLRSQQLLSEAGIATPKTVVIESLASVDSAVALLGGAPVVLKDPAGTFGSGVVLAESLPSARSVVDALWKGEPYPLLVQEYVQAAKGADLRIFIVGGKVVAAMERKASDGEFRSNVELGAQAYSVQPTAEQSAIALAATQVLGLEVSGVDLIQSERGPLVLEVNANPGFKKLSEVTGVDVAKAIVQYAESLR